MASTTPVSPSTAAVVGTRFVLQYYTMLNSSPQSLVHLYKENSTLTHGNEDLNNANFETVSGQEKIDKKIQSLQYQDCKVNLSVVDCQPSQDGGVLVVVIGWMANKGQSYKKFMQTFFLAVQQEPSGFFVLNDIFRFLKEGTMDTAPSSSVETSQQGKSAVEEKKVEKVAHEQPKAKEEKIVEEAKSVAAPSHAQPAHPSPSETEKTPAVKEEKAAPAPSSKTEPAAAPAAPKHPNPAPHTPAKSATAPPPATAPSKQASAPPSVAPTSAAPASAPTPAAPATTTTAAPAAAAAPTPAPAPTSPQQKKKPNTWASLVGGSEELPKENIAAPQNAKPAKADKADKSDKVEKASSQVPPKGERRSLYVSNLPFNATDDQVLKAFPYTHEIRYHTLFPAKGYGFVEYDVELAGKVLQLVTANPVTIEGRQLKVEEKRPKDKDKPYKSDKEGKSGQKDGQQKDRSKRDINGAKGQSKKSGERTESQDKKSTKVKAPQNP